MPDLGQIRPGEVICGRYRIDRLLKEGGMGAVYVAEHTATRKRIALKLMRPDIIASESARTRFAQEAQASGIIESPYVVDVYDAGVDPETQIPFIAMELLSGIELGELVHEQGALAPAEVVDFVTQTARALDRAHAAGIIHRDLKPDNLFLSHREGEAPRVKVLDFGIAKFLAGAGAETTRAAGTPLYMAPEQTKRGANIGPATDIWALGLIAYTLLVGRPYWEGEDLHEIFGEILAGAEEAPSARAARVKITLPPAFDAWFLQCVASEPGRRFGRAGDAASALADALGVPLRPSLGSSDPSLAYAARGPLRSRPDGPSSTGRTPNSVEAAATALALGPTQAIDDAALAPKGVAPAPRAAERTRSPASASLGGSALSDTVVPPARPSRRPRVFATAAVALALAASGGFFAWRYARGAPASRVPLAAAVALGLSDATCALLDDGTVRCAGARLDRDGDARTPEPMTLRATATALSLGKHHGCARLLDTTVQCWGHNETGALGDGTTRSHGPADVPGLRNVEQIVTSIHGGCVRLAAGKIKCWGANRYGQVGDGSTSDRLAPIEIEGAHGALAVALGQDHACALFADGTVRCWGRNAAGELGTGDRLDRSKPTPVTGLAGAVSIALGGHFSCAVLGDGSARCWGSNADGELGDGTTESSRDHPTQVVGLEDVRQIAAGWKHACARLKGGAVRCWGHNESGQVGDGTTTTRTIPVAIAGAYTQLAAGRMHTCGIREGGALWCWGRNEEGQLGDGTTATRLEAVATKW